MLSVKLLVSAIPVRNRELDLMILMIIKMDLMVVPAQDILSSSFCLSVWEANSSVLPARKAWWQ